MSSRQLSYLDFDLLVERTGAKYMARVMRSPAGQATAEFEFPFSDLEIENLMLRVGRPRKGTRRADSPELQEVKKFGGRLFEAVFNPEVRAAFRSSYDLAQSQEAGLRLRLSFVNTPELMDLPWEFLYSPAQNRFLALSVSTPLVRFIDLPQTLQPFTVRPPLRILSMFSSPTDYEELDAEAEWGRLRSAVSDLEQRQLITLDRLENASLDALRKAMRRNEYHVFHFVGHGSFDPLTQDGMLILEDEHERGRRTSGQYLGQLLSDHRSLRLVILNACEGARTSRSDPFAGVAQSLMQQGLPAVIAMQFEISDDAAIVFAHEFYSALADGYPVDAALSNARSAIFSQPNELEWGTPVLYLRAPNGRIFDIAPMTDEDRKKQQLSQLLNASDVEAAKENWDAALERVRAAMAIDPNSAEAIVREHKLVQQREWAQLYGQGKAHFQTGRWREARETFNRLRGMKPDYKDVDALLASAQRELDQGTANDQKRARIAALEQDAQAAMTRREWAKAIQKWQALLTLDPGNAEAATQISRAQSSQELDALYATARQYYSARQWNAAIEHLQRLKAMGGSYPDTDKLLESAQRELARATPNVSASTMMPRPESAPPIAAPKKSRGIVGGLSLLTIGACVGIALVIGACALLLASQQRTTTSSDLFLPESNLTFICYVPNRGLQCQLPQLVPIGASCSCQDINGLWWTGVTGR